MIKKIMAKQKTIALFLLFIFAGLGLAFTQSASSQEDGYLVSGFNAFSTDGYMSNLAVRIVETDQYGRLVTAHEWNNENEHFIRVHRHLANGELDESFGTNGRADITIPNLHYKLFVKAIGYQKDGSGKILIAVSQDIGNNGSYDFVVVRLTPEGEIDSTFNIMPKTFRGDTDYQGLGDMVIQDDGKIVLLGSVPDCGIIFCDSDFGVVRYNPDGTFDKSFAGDGYTQIDLGSNDEVVVNADMTDDGRIVFFGKQYDNVSDSIFIAGRLMPNGSRDNSFGHNGFVGHDFHFRTDGNGILFDDNTMAVTNYLEGVLKLNADGSLDESFGTGGILDVSATGLGSTHAILAHPDGGFLVAGFSNKGGESHTRMAKYSAAGKLDLQFGEKGVAQFPGNEVSNFVVHLTFANDGRILMSVGTKNNNLNKMLFRILPDGQLDTGGWVTNNITPLDDNINDMVIQPNGKIVAIGNILDTGMGLARYNPDGSFDTDFGFGRGYLTNGNPRNYGLATAVDSAGRIIAVRGIVDTDDGINFKVPRYQPNGSLSLWPSGRPINGMIGNWGGVTDFATEIEMYPDESFIVVGNSDGTVALTRYTAAGAVDTTFGSGGTAKPPIAAGNALASGTTIQSDGKIIVTGSVAKKLFIMRLNSNGTYDPTFNGNGLVVLDVPNSTNERFNDVVVLPDGKIIAVGSVTKGGNSELLAMRFNSNGSPDNTFFDDARLELPFGGDASLEAITMEADGSVMMAGCVEDTVDHFVAVRLESDGKPDFDFGDSSILEFAETPTMGDACALAIARDVNTGEFVLAGYTTNTEGRQQFALVRFKYDPPSAPPPPTVPPPTPIPDPEDNFYIYLPVVVKP